MHCLRLLSIWILGCALAPPVVAQTDQSPSAANSVGEEFFERSIRPLLADHCWECHGPDKQWNGLRLDSRAAILRGGDSGSSLNAEQPNASLLLRTVRQEGDLQMPPDEHLTSAQIAALEQWVSMGAPWPATPVAQNDAAWRSHWAFQPVRPTEPPMNDSAWCRNEIDSFVLSRLNEHDIQPVAPADRRTLIRRATYALTGLSPSYEEIESFVNDADTNAYERLVDRLLDSPHYGEHLGRMWLDVARYSDTKGYVYAREERFFVNAALYRDWVIDALNRDLPYDQFLKLQIAADQCDPDHPESLAAMGLLTLGRRFLGVSHDIIDDRIDVIGRGTMGLTISCARCHDHKYDPIPTADYYSLYGVFQCCTDRQVDLRPFAKTQPSAEFLAELDRRTSALVDANQSARQEAAQRVRARLGDYLFAQTELAKYGEEGFDVILATNDVIPAFVRRWESYLSRQNADDSVFGPWLQLQALPTDQFAERVRELVTSIRQDPRVHPWISEMLVDAPENLRALADRYGAVFSKVDQRASEINAIAADQRGDEDVAWLQTARPLLDVMYGDAAPCKVPDEEIIATETYFDSSTCEQLWKLQGEVDRWRLQADAAPTVAVAVFDRSTLNDPRIFRRGNPANKGARVSRHFLSLLDGEQPVAFENGSGRLELANRIADPANPLTARVWVNRLWQHIFGSGLVLTASDFGLRATAPSNPELLDWLAQQLTQSNWSTKAIVRAMLLSATFQQSSVQPNSDLAVKYYELDPDNRWLWRMNGRRLQFEEIRDSLLQASKQLDDRIGGKAREMFNGDGNVRRTVYGLVDRQFLPTTLRVFDFANPDLHVAKRSETTVPQQSLYFLNHPFLAARARTLASAVSTEATSDSKSTTVLLEQISQLYRAVLKRDPTSAECDAALAYLQQPNTDAIASPSPATLAWSYGFGEVDMAAGKLKSFTSLPHFTGSAWQGGTAYPDAALGWVQLTATGGHPGDDLAHASIRRWTAPAAMSVSISSIAKHEPEISDGIRLQIISSSHGRLAEATLHSNQADMNVEKVAVEAGDTIDFVVDILQELNSDQHLWSPIIQRIDSEKSSADSRLMQWSAASDFVGPATSRLTELEQLAQVLMMTNEFWYVD